MVNSSVKLCTPFRVLMLCTFANLLNFMDREIIAGSPNEFEDFVHETLGVSVGNEGVYIGYLTSTFIVVFAISIMAFGNLVHRVPPFRLLSFGTLLWVLAVFLSGGGGSKQRACYANRNKAYGSMLTRSCSPFEFVLALGCGKRVERRGGGCTASGDAHIH